MITDGWHPLLKVVTGFLLSSLHIHIKKNCVYYTLTRVDVDHIAWESGRNGGGGGGGGEEGKGERRGRGRERRAHKITYSTSDSFFDIFDALCHTSRL